MLADAGRFHSHASRGADGRNTGPTGVTRRTSAATDDDYVAVTSVTPTSGVTELFAGPPDMHGNRRNVCYLR